MRAAWGAAALAVALAACSSRVVVSERVVASGAAPVEGLIYSLPQTLITVEAKEDEKAGVQYTITPTIVPDPAARFRLKAVENSFADTDIDIKVNESGLLTSATATVTDQTGQVVITVAKTIATGVRIGAAGGPVECIRPPAKKGEKSPYPFKVVFGLARFLEGAVLPDCASLSATAPADVAQGGPMPDCNFSLCYRTPVLIRAGIQQEGAPVRSSFAFLAIDPTRTEGLDLRSAGLVKRVSAYTFANGVATGSRVDQSSTALAVANLPLDVLKAILAVPAELLTLKVKNVDEDAKLQKAKVDLVNQQAAMIEAVAKLNRANAPSTGGVAGTGSSP